MGALVANPEPQTPDAQRRSPDPEDLHIRNELKRLRDDTEARRTFYDDLRHTVERVRSGARDEDVPERNAARPPSVSPASRDADGEPADPPASSEPRRSPPTGAHTSHASLYITGGSIDRAAYLRVVRWAKANDAPVPLALGVAWVESRLRTDPPRGAAGEVGMFQIMPARCKIEGWPPKRLKEPEFNAWLGTWLLARYYQEEGNWARAAAKYVAGPRVFNKRYSGEAWNYINWYASSVNSYAGYFSKHQGSSAVPRNS